MNRKGPKLEQTQSWQLWSKKLKLLALVKNRTLSDDVGEYCGHGSTSEAGVLQLVTSFTWTPNSPLPMSPHIIYSFRWSTIHPRYPHSNYQPNLFVGSQAPSIEKWLVGFSGPNSPSCWISVGQLSGRHVVRIEIHGLPGLSKVVSGVELWAEGFYIPTYLCTHFELCWEVLSGG